MDDLGAEWWLARREMARARWRRAQARWRRRQSLRLFPASVILGLAVGGLAGAAIVIAAHWWQP